MFSKQKNNSTDSLEEIYLLDFLSNGLKKQGNHKELIAIIICNVGLISIGICGYLLLINGFIPRFNIDYFNKQEINSVETQENFSLILNKSSINLNIDEDEIGIIEVSTSDKEKAFKISYEYSNIINMDEVSNEEGKITFQIEPQSIGTGYIEFKLSSSEDKNKSYDTKRVNIVVDGTLDIGTFNNHLYQVFNDSTTWSEAKVKCEELGGHLATIESEEEQEFIQQIIKSSKKDNIWLGGVYLASNNSWAWVDNTSWNFVNWDVSQPDNYTGDEMYLRMKNRDKTYDFWESYDGKWNDTADNADGLDTNNDAPISSFGFICEWDYIETSLTSLKITDKNGYNGTEELVDCFENTYDKEQACSISFSGRNQKNVTFDFSGIEYRTFEYDVSIAKSTAERFINSDEYDFDSDFELCDIDLIAISNDGTETRMDAYDILSYGFFSRESCLHHNLILPEGTVAIRFEGNSWQSYSEVKVILADAKLNTILPE